jgi:hypothetical protein
MPTGRAAAVVRVEDFETPLAVNAKPYVLVIPSERVPVPIGIKLARAFRLCDLESDPADIRH